MPQGEHSTIQAELIIALNGALKSPKIARASCSIALCLRLCEAVSFRNPFGTTRERACPHLTRATAS